MKRVIYSLYIDVPKEELDVFDKNILKPNVVPTNYKTKSEFKKNYDDLVACKQAYACLLYTSPSPRDVEESRMPSSA